MGSALQWGGRFATAPDAELLAFGSSLEEDLVLAPFDVECSRGHVLALLGGDVISEETADDLLRGLETVATEIASGEFGRSARERDAEDVHGAIDARVRELSGASGAFLHSGRSRNDQVATTLLLYARDRAKIGRALSERIAASFLLRAEQELEARTLLAGTTHWQPAQPILLAFWLCAAAEMFVRASTRFARVAHDASQVSPLGSGALAGSTLPLDRAAAAQALGLGAPSRNALDAIGNRDTALDLAHAYVRAVLDASRVSEELVLWCTPAFGYVRLGDAASTGSSLMPQKRNPDPFELVRGTAANLTGAYAGALATTAGVALSYHRDLQQTKGAIIDVAERGSRALRAFERAFAHVDFNRQRMSEVAGNGYTVATDLADALIARGVSAREAHAFVGGAVARAEAEGRPLNADDVRLLAQFAGIDAFDAPLEPFDSVAAKRTSGSTSPQAVRESIDALRRILEGQEAVQ
ncbi:MAG: argininosuccinate lyase [Vulcanimicrobiaceae bacterium]